MKLINDFINEEYKFNGQQVTEAFKLAVKRELWLDGKRINPSTFGHHLSVNVVGQVLTAYKEHKRDSTARPSGYNYNQLPEATVKKITPSEAWDLVLKFTKEDGCIPLGAPYALAYEYLLEKGQVKEVRNLATKSKGRFSAALQDFTFPEKEAVKEYLIKNVLS